MTRRGLVLVLIVGAGAATDARAQTPHPQPAQHGANPTVSPDGGRIAFLSDRDGTEDLYVMNADGSGVRRLSTGVRPGGRPYWSADGRELTFNVTANDTVRVMAIPVDGGAVTERATFAGTKGVLTFAGGSRVVLGIGSWTETQLYTSRIDGSGRTALTADHAAYWCPAVTTRGDLIAVGRRDSSEMQIWLVNTDGSGARALTRFTKSDGSPQCPSFSSDERRLAVQSEVPDPRDSKRLIGNIWIVDVATGQAVRLADHTTPYADELPAWFPDGKRIAFQSDRTGRWEVWAMNADGTDVRQLTR